MRPGRVNCAATILALCKVADVDRFRILAQNVYRSTTCQMSQ